MEFLAIYDMGRPIYIPQIEAISNHVEAAVNHAMDGFASAEGDEDTV